MTQMALRAVTSADQHPSNHPHRPAPQTISARIGAMASAQFERLVLMVLFLVFVGAIWQISVMAKMTTTLDQMAVVVTDVSSTTSGNRVVSCTDLSVQAPAVAAALPQCSASPHK